MPVQSRVARLLQLVEALHAPLAPPADAELPPVLSALVQPEADAVEVLWCWRVAARHGLALPASSADAHGARLVGSLVAAGEAVRLPELAGPTGRLLPPEGAEPVGAPPELLLAAWCAAGDAAAARTFLERSRARSPLAAAKAWRAAGPWLGPKAAACAATVVQDGAWIADEDARDLFLILVGLRACPPERLSRLDEAQLDHLAGAKAGGPARVAWLERLDPARRARRSQFERADAIVADLRSAGVVGEAWSFSADALAKLARDEGRATTAGARLPTAPRQAVNAAWFDPVPGRALGGAP
jgi:hypothetical protein